MKFKFTPLIILVSGIVAMQSCGDDESPAADVLVTSNRQTGVFYEVDQQTGDTTRIFTPTISGSNLTNVRAFVYHKSEDAFFASATSSIITKGGGDFKAAGIPNPSGFLYRIDPRTKVGTVINNNDGNGGAYDVWDAINNWAVAKDDSLVAIGDFNSDGNGIVKFGVDGGRSLKTIEVDICCGNGMLYDRAANSMLVSTDDGTEGKIDVFNINSTGEITETITITTFDGFDEDLTTTRVHLKAMALNKKGVVYGLLFHRDLGITYLVTVDLLEEKVSHLKTLGDSYDNQFNSLAFIPAKYAK